MDNNRPVFGVQEFLRITTVPAAANQTLKGRTLVEVGSLTVAGAYTCEIDTQGIKDIEVNIKASAVSGSFAPTLASLFLDGTPQDSAAGVNISTTNQEIALSGLNGTRRARVSFTIPGGGSVTFDRAEVRGM